MAAGSSSTPAVAASAAPAASAPHRLEDALAIDELLVSKARVLTIDTADRSVVLEVNGHSVKAHAAKKIDLSGFKVGDDALSTLEVIKLIELRRGGGSVRETREDVVKPADGTRVFDRLVQILAVNAVDTQAGRIQLRNAEDRLWWVRVHSKHAMRVVKPGDQVRVVVRVGELLELSPVDAAH